ncbi:WAS protein family-like protein 1-like [Iris pallida]|uniref:WAS protein family-like protein 1-like n=1 Tax=Iris pallida TaxID=29817 RepID=A0AAX6DKH1_IRIPA|nr:WAS protein family-like protein 1-like [Iris pallida]KAJ6830006.1 WAS protein family-like protein 1-like [Iris pallida]
MASAASCSLLHPPFQKTHIHSFPSLPSPRHLSSPSLCHFPTLSAAGAGPIEPVIEPALKHANVLYFQAGYNVQIVVDEEESDEALLRRFRREVSKAGVIQECKRRRFFENKQEEKKRKHREACRRNRRRRLGPRFNASTSQSEAEAASKAREDADDNWDLPVGDLPY